MFKQISPFTSDETALDWAAHHFPHKEKRLIRCNPWSRIFELVGNSATAYLKLIPLRQPVVLKINSVLSLYFEEILPEVIAVNQELGVLLLREHGGVDLNGDTSEVQLRKLLKTYAEMQVNATKIPDVLSSVPEIQLTGFVDKFLNFLEPKDENSNSTDYNVNADYFLGADKSRVYYDVLTARKDLLRDFLRFAEHLPATINHCDLRTDNAAEGYDGSCILYDWDDAVIGPAGLSLHSIFGACTRIALLLNDDCENTENDEETGLDNRLLNTYITELAENGYAPSRILRDALPASACIGLMQCMLTYSNFPDDDRDYVDTVAGLFKGYLGDLLDLCDFLSHFDRKNVLYFADDYQQKKGFRRASSLLQKYLNDHPNDFEVRKKLASVLQGGGKWDDAIACYKKILQFDPEDAQNHNDYGIALLKSNNPAAASVEFENALSIRPSFDEAQDNLDKATELLAVIEKAERPTTVPTLRISTEELKGGKLASEKLDLAPWLFNKYGTLVIENVFQPDLLQAIKELVLHKYHGYYIEKEHNDALQLGDKRYMVTLDIEESLNTPDIYDNPFMSAILKKILGGKFILGGLNIAVSLPGASYQAVHKDYPPLFDEDDDDVHRDKIPSFAVSLLIPLVQHSHTVGTTLVIKGSHVVSNNESINKLPGQSPLLDIGSCLLMDYRLSHQGLANRSDIVRPVLCLIFHRPWFRDSVNYTKQPAIKITENELRRVPEQLRHLFSWTKIESTRLRAVGSISG